MGKMNKADYYLIRVLPEDGTTSGEVVGILSGSFHQISKMPPSVQCYKSHLARVELVQFDHYSEMAELAEFRMLNYKDRIIVRSLESDRLVIFGQNSTESIYYAFDFNGTLVLRGPVAIEQTTGKQWHYSDQLVVSLSHYAVVAIHTNPSNHHHGPQTRVTIHLPESSKFAVERNTPYRFQQKTIVQRQKEKIQATSGMMALETFDQWL